MSVKSICLSFQAPPDAGFVPPDASGCDATSYGSLAVLIQVDPAPDCQLEFFRIHPVEFMISEVNSLYFQSHAKMALENKTCLRKYGADHLFFTATCSVGEDGDGDGETKIIPRHLRTGLVLGSNACSYPAAAFAKICEQSQLFQGAKQRSKSGCQNKIRRKFQKRKTMPRQQKVVFIV